MTGTRPRRIHVPEAGNVWFFAYGSLMWDPGFTPLEVRPGLLYGWHRQFCVWSRRYRGTAERPGLVLGLDRGGSCRGRVLCVAEADRDRVFDYLEEREMPEDIYTCRKLRVHTPQGPVDAYGFVVNRDNFLYAGRLAPERIVACIARCAGNRGSNLEYLENTVRHLDELNIGDGPMHRLLDMVRQSTAREGRET